MTADRLALIELAYHDARDRLGEDQSRFLDEVCGADTLMRQQVEALLRQDSAANSLLDRPAIDAVLESIAPGTDQDLSGTDIGVYEVIERIGSGGMGEVYVAHDTSLNRRVALKVLPSSFVADPGRLARLRREAHVLASLSHPNIGAIYRFEDTEFAHALVLEFVDGPTLADRIAEGPVPIDEALAIARQIVEALAAAHEQGVIHRDLKPANIKVRPDGTVKVLDFGLAILAQAPDSGLQASGGFTQSPTITTPAMTSAGMIVGTAAYMSPEQAKGKPADKRGDIWAFGCVLYEMVTGKRAFEREDVSGTLSAVLNATPDWSLWPDVVPRHICELVEGCLEKDRKNRVADISTARFVLTERRTPAILPAPPGRHEPPRQRVMLLAGIVSIAAVVGGMVAWWPKPAANETVPPITRFSIALGEDQQFTNAGRRLLAISPDGTQIVYVANQRLYLRRLSDPDARPIPGTESSQGVTTPAFSPDGQFIAFWSDGRLKRLAVTGGTAAAICPADALFGMTWGPDGILFGQDGKRIMRVAADGGTPQLLLTAKPGELASDPQALPEDRGILFTLVPEGEGRGGAELWDKARIVVQTSRESEPKTLITGGSSAQYLPTGHIVYAVAGRLVAASFDLRDLAVRSDPISVLDGVARSFNTPAAQFSVSNTGSLVYVPGPVLVPTRLQFHLALLDGTAKAELLKLPPDEYESPRVSPDGTQIALGVGNDRQGDIWIYDVAGGSALRRLTFGGTNRFPVWSGDGRYIAFQSDRDGDRAVFWQRADISGPMAERLTKPQPGSSHIAESWSPQSNVFTYSVFSESSRRFTLATFSISDRQSHVLEGIESTLPLASEFSPDGRWLSYNVSDSTLGPAQATVFVEPFPTTGARYQVSQSRNGFHPVWLRNGRGLSYSTGIGPEGPLWVVVPVTLQPRFSFGTAMKVANGGLVDSVPFGAVSERNFDFTPDGQRVGRVIVPAETSAGLSAANPESRRSIPVQVVLNWGDELRQRVPQR